MPRRPQAFKQTDVVRAVRSAQRAGLASFRIEIDPSGKISIVSGSNGSVTEELLDAELAEFEAQNGQDRS